MRASKKVLRDLGEGLVLRQATRKDIDAIAGMNAVAFSETGEPDEQTRAWTRALMDGSHPVTKATDFTLVEDTVKGAVVSSLCLMSQQWQYDGIPFGVGQVELVATHPEYRRRGLIRAQVEVVHGWSARRGEMVQAIDGIPTYYRQFGYEMALESWGGRVGYPGVLPGLKEGESEPYQLRIATIADSPFFVELYDYSRKRYLVTRNRGEEIWRYEISIPRGYYAEYRVIETSLGESIGFLTHGYRLRERRLQVYRYELKPGVPWKSVTPTVVRYLYRTGEAYAQQDKEKRESFAECHFMLGSDHPAYHIARDWLITPRRPYAWYIRVPDVPGFIRRIAPVLEKRLACSSAFGYTGELKISFAPGGVRLAFDKGRLSRIEPWGPTKANSFQDWRKYDAVFPNLLFLHLLFGHRSTDEIESMFADCFVRTDEIRELLNTLFPRLPSRI